jgi:hypothetical protein
MLLWKLQNTEQLWKKPKTAVFVWIDPCVMSGGFGAWSAVGYYRWYIECNMLREIEARLRNNWILIVNIISSMIYLEDETTTKISCCALNFFSESSWPLLILMLHVKIKVTDHSENISIIRILATQGPSHPNLIPWIQSRKFKCESYDWWQAPSDGISSQYTMKMRSKFGNKCIAVMYPP